MLRKSIVLTIVISLFLTILNVYALENEPSPWAESYVNASQSSNTLDSTFFKEYQSPITRAEFAYLTVRLYESISNNETVIGDASFTDTQDSFILKAKNHNLISGYPNGTFKPDRLISRSELAKLLTNLLDALSLDYLQASSQQYKDDASIPYWAKESVYIARSNNLINGIGNNTYGTQNNTTKEQALIVYAQLLSKYSNDFTFNDLYIPSSILLNVGEDPQTSVFLSWRNSKNVNDNVIRLYKQVDSKHVLIKEIRVEAKNVMTQLNGKNYSYNTFSTEITGLDPGTQYFYNIGNGLNWTNKKTFKTVDSGPTNFALYGDVQGAYQRHYNQYLNTFDTSLHLDQTPDIHLLAGDVVDRSDKFEEWQYLNNAMKDHFSTKLFSAALGNHDNFDEGSVFEALFTSPHNGVIGLENRNYWFEVDNAIVAVWDTESSSRFKDQSTWLTNIMAQSDKPFKIVLMHRSAYPMRYNESHIRKLTSTFEEAGIDLVLSGHDHIYNRTSMFNGQKSELNNGIVYVCGGSSSGSKYYSEDSNSTNRYWRDVVYDTNNPVFSLFTVTKDEISFNAYAVINDSPTLIDSFVIVR